jgi:hypothetical protein
VTVITSVIYCTFTVTIPYYLTVSDTVQWSGTTGSDRDLIQLRSHSTRPMTSRALTAHQTALSLWLEICPLFCSLQWQCFRWLSAKFFLWCVLWKSSANECSLFNRKHFSQAMTYSDWKIKQKTYPDEWDDTAVGWLALANRDHTALSSGNWLNKHSWNNLISRTIKEDKIQNLTAFTEAHHQKAEHISVHFTEQCKISFTLTLLMWRIWWAPNNASRWQMGFNLAFKGLTDYLQPGFTYVNQNKWKFTFSKSNS